VETNIKIIIQVLFDIDHFQIKTSQHNFAEYYLLLWILF